MLVQRLRVGSQGQTYQLLEFLEFGVYVYTHICAHLHSQKLCSDYLTNRNQPWSHSYKLN